jgi:hypothetical protein
MLLSASNSVAISTSELEYRTSLDKSFHHVLKFAKFVLHDPPALQTTVGYTNAARAHVHIAELAAEDSGSRRSSAAAAKTKLELPTCSSNPVGERKVSQDAQGRSPARSSSVASLTYFHH